MSFLAKGFEVLWSGGMDGAPELCVINQGIYLSLLSNLCSSSQSHDLRLV